MFLYFYRIAYCTLAPSFVHYDLNIPIILNTALKCDILSYPNFCCLTSVVSVLLSADLNTYKIYVLIVRYSRFTPKEVFG